MPDLIITTSEIKKEILLNRSLNKCISDTKIMTKKEVYDLFLGKISTSAWYRLSLEFNLNIETSKVYLKNLLTNTNKLRIYKDFLMKENLIEKQIINNFENVTIINTIIDDLVLNFFDKSKVNYKNKDELFMPDVCFFNNTSEEISYIAKTIIKSNLPLDKVKIVHLLPENKTILKKIFNMYNIPINIKESESIFKTKSFINFYNNLVITKDIDESLKLVFDKEISLKIVNYFNSHNFDKIDELALKIIKEDFKTISLNKNKIKNAVDIIDVLDIYNDEYYYFLMSFNNSLPKTYKDEDFLSDIEKNELNILTSYEKNKKEKEIFLNILKSTENLVITYSSKSTFISYNPSNIINDFKLNVIKDINEDYSFSDNFNKYSLSKMIDEYIKFGTKSDDLIVLNNSYNIPYLKYDNKFTKISKDYIKLPINLSYSSVKMYYVCAFKYYIEKVLKINKFEKSLHANYGSVVHAILSKVYNEDFDLEKCYKEEIVKYNFSVKEKFFLDILVSDLDSVIDFLIKFNKDTKLNKNLSEKAFIIENIIPNKVNFKGIIDSIKYSEEDKLLALIDYKTGNVDLSLDNINHGFNLQLPCYLYLTSKTFYDYKTTGFYLHQIFYKPKIGVHDKELKFEGYSTTNEIDLKKLDSGYANSQYIKGLKLSKNGLHTYAKVLDEKNIIKVRDIAQNKILEAGKNIIEANFDINPKEITGKVKKCKYCKYKDICYVKNTDTMKLNDTKLIDLL